MPVLQVVENSPTKRWHGHYFVGVHGEDVGRVGPVTSPDITKAKVMTAEECQQVAWQWEAWHTFEVTEPRPVVVCLCGSTRFYETFQKANFQETLAGRIVLTIGCDTKADVDLFDGWGKKEVEALKARLDWLHLRKIDMADEVLILNVDGYIGESTRRELEYAQAQGKRVRFWIDEMDR